MELTICLRDSAFSRAKEHIADLRFWRVQCSDALRVYSLGEFSSLVAATASGNTNRAEMAAAAHGNRSVRPASSP